MIYIFVVLLSSNDNLILNIDMAPTIFDLAGINIPENIHGKSIFGLLSGEEQNFRDVFIYEGLGNYGRAKPNLTVVSKDFRYIVTYEDSNLNEVIFRELYDQVNDPDEMVNLINNPSYKNQNKNEKTYKFHSNPHCSDFLPNKE